MGGVFRVFCEKTRKNPGGLGFLKKSGFFCQPWNLAYLVANTYGLNVIKIGGI